MELWKTIKPGFFRKIWNLVLNYGIFAQNKISRAEGARNFFFVDFSGYHYFRYESDMYNLS